LISWQQQKVTSVNGTNAQPRHRHPYASDGAMTDDAARIERAARNACIRLHAMVVARRTSDEARQ
jgi:hypothetical protein